MQVSSSYVGPQAYRGLQFKRVHTSGLEIIRNIAAREGIPLFLAATPSVTLTCMGGIGGFWRGVGVSVAATVPATAVQMAGYEFFKVRFMSMWKLPEDHFVVHSAAGAVAGTLAAMVTNPIDIVKTRLQVDPDAKSLIAVSRDLFKQHGWRGFGVGIVPRVLMFAPRTSLSFVLYELAMKMSSETSLESASKLVSLS